MAETLTHRGLDGMTIWVHPERPVGLGHNRLAIIDLVGGEQPLWSSDGRYVVVNNGEIYNYKALRKTLEADGHAFKTHSDTEVILEAYRKWGIECLSRLNGMFAFALYDLVDDRIIVARDRTGIKPLYYHMGPTGFYFGSEMKAILRSVPFTPHVNYQALADLFTLGYPLMPSTCFTEIEELEPGTWMDISRQGIKKGPFWQWARNPQNWDAPRALEESRKAILESLEEHMVSDVPIGAFLSGGIDSSLLVAMMAQDFGRKIETFNVRFGEMGYDESPYARMVADHLDLKHNELVVDMSTPDLSMVHNILCQFDQPFIDSSAIPTFLICREIRKHVKVAIAGDGGDEMFGGYDRFRHADLARHLGHIPPFITSGVEKIIEQFKTFKPDRVRMGRRFYRAIHARDEGRLMALSCYNFPDTLSSIVTEDVMRKIGTYRSSLSLNGPMHDPGGAAFVDATVQFALPGDYLRKVDVMSSANGLEVRVPFLGGQVLKCAAQIPHDLKYTLRENKIMLRTLAKSYLPKAVVEKPKAGFGIPVDTWLGEEGRRELVETLRAPSSALSTMLNPEYLDTLLSAFVSQDWDRTRWSRFNLYQQTYMLWSLDTWLKRWNPTL